MKSFLLLIINLYANIIIAQPTIEWQKLYGGSNSDQSYSILQTLDDGYIFCGTTYSSDGDITYNHGESDVWVVKLDPYGNIQWQKCFGGSFVDYGRKIIQTNDGGYAFTGWTESNDGDVSGNHSFNKDYWVVKLDASGNIQWQKCFGGSIYDFGYDIIQTNDNGYAIAGYAVSNDGDVSVSYGNGDVWIIKLNSAGILQWENSFGGTEFDLALSIKQTFDNGYIVAGTTNSNDINVSFNMGLSDIWLLKLNSNGQLQWEKHLVEQNKILVNLFIKLRMVVLL